MPSKQVTDREKASRAIVSAAETHAADCAAGLTRELSPFLKAGEAMPDVALLVRLFGRKDAAANAVLVTADRVHEKELADDVAPRAARDAASDEVRAVLIDLRAAFDTAYGAEALSAFGLAPAVPTDASVVAALASDVLKNLEDPQVKLPKPRRAALKVDRAAFAEDLHNDLPPLQKALAKVAKEDREKEATQSAKNEAMANNDAAFSICADWLSATFIAAGLPEQAEKVRPSGRRPGQRKAEEQDGAPAPMESPGGGAGG